MGLKVKAKERGYYGFQIREPNTPSAKFEIAHQDDFSHVWMSPIGWKPPAQRKTGPVVDKAEEGEAAPLAFKGAKPEYSDQDVTISLDEAINRAIDDGDMSLKQWNELQDNKRKSLTLKAVKQLIDEELENRADDDDGGDEDDEVSEDDEEDLEE